ncbi:DNA-binding transcriptional regulator, MerR family [Anaerocolumna jejuensis DSM 15929]|jgi:DNA-binding transcriptional MerR regulator|uniref:DNA-binding transcriptional regulator, MerR family n=1 Tax=Anaerocolumna jejuensis DSM 15929 TaxID=1121322 RepID=A0A1M6YSJ0_9FIRM|nr:MerR family transcriptional regulator [Anaerocolumna jejuensis]SHL21009.1 DNA-binding transcriptional regulator, MerR family [Anaerocolumna jejuensis DSM 15929]
MYTIKEVSDRTGLSIYTLRYYDKEGLLPLIKRTPSGIRKFSDNDIAWIGLICCLKNSGMSIDNVKKFMNLCLKGEETAENRKEMLLEHKEHILQQMNELQNSLSTVNYKINHYKEIGIFHIDGDKQDAV